MVLREVAIWSTNTPYYCCVQFVLFCFHGASQGIFSFSVNNFVLKDCRKWRYLYETWRFLSIPSIDGLSQSNMQQVYPVSLEDKIRILKATTTHSTTTLKPKMMNCCAQAKKFPAFLDVVYTFNCSQLGIMLLNFLGFMVAISSS